MNITALAIENVGKFEKFECDFSPGLNVIKGANEAGKSTLVKAIAAALFASAKAGAEKGTSSKRWKTAATPIVKTAFRSEDFDGVLERNLDSGKARLADQRLNLTIEDQARIQEIVASNLGLPSAEIFLATACSPQGNMASIDESLEAITDKLECLVTGGRQDQAASEVISKIDQRIAAIAGSDEKSPGLLKKLEAAQVELDYEIDKLKRDISHLKGYRESLAQLVTALANTEEDYRQKKRLLDERLRQANALTELAAVGRDLDELEDRLLKARESMARVQQLRQELADLPVLERGDEEQVEEIESTLRYLRPKQRELEKEVTEAAKEAEAVRTGVFLPLWFGLSLAGFVFSVVDLILGLTQFVYHIGGLGLASAMASSLFLSRNLQRKAFLREQHDAKKRRFDEGNKEIEQLGQQLRRILEKYRINSSERIRQFSWKRNELESRLHQETAHLEEILGNKNIKELEEMRAALKKKESELKELALAAQSNPPEEAEISRLKQVVAQLEEQMQNLEKGIQLSKRQLQTAEGGAELLASYLERKDELTRHKLKLVEELSILGLTRESIEAARQHVMMSTLELLEKRVSEILEVMTGGKYRQVRLDTARLCFQVFSEDKRDWVDPQRELSQATVEQLHFAARLALTEILASDAKPPLILDDPFGCLDADRLEKTMSLLRNLAADRQILLLSSDDRFDRYADHTIRL